MAVQILAKNWQWKTMVTGVILCGIWLRFHDLGRLPLWLDEAYSAWFASRDWGYLWREVPKFETHPSLYYSILKIWTHFWGSSEFALRSLSVVASVVAIPIIAATAWQCGGRTSRYTASLMSALLFACSSQQLAAAQDARPYTFLTLGMVITLWGATRIMVRSDLATQRVPSSGGRDGLMDPALAALGGGIALMAWSHNLGPLFGIIVGGGLLLWWAFNGRSLTLFHKIAGAGVLALLLYAPNFSTVFMQMRSVGNHGFWLARPDVPDLLYTALAMPMGYALPSFMCVIAVAMCGAGFLVLKRAGGSCRSMAWLLLMVALVPMLLTFAISQFAQPLFLPRTLQPSQVPLILLMSFAPFFVPRLKQVVSIALVCLAVASAVFYFIMAETDLHEDWRNTAIAIRDRTRRVTPVVVTVSTEPSLPLRYYAERLDIPMDIISVPEAYPAINPAYHYPVGGGGAPAITADMIPPLLARLKSVDRLWIVARNSALFDPDGLIDAALAKNFPCRLFPVAARGDELLRSRRTGRGDCPKV